MIKQLEDADVIVHRRGRIEITDRKGLKDMTCECYGIVRAQLTTALPEIGMN